MIDEKLCCICNVAFLYHHTKYTIKVTSIDPGFNISSQGKKHKSLAKQFIEVTTRIKKEGEIFVLFLLSRRRDLDPRPRDYKSRALPLSYAGNSVFASAKVQLFFKKPTNIFIFFIFSNNVLL